MNVCVEMPKYECHKKVWALKIADITEPTDATGTSRTIVPADEGYGPFVVDGAYMEKHKPEVGGYYVVYADGYKSFSPAKAFEDGYSKHGDDNAIEKEIQAKGLTAPRVTRDDLEASILSEHYITGLDLYHASYDLPADTPLFEFALSSLQCLTIFVNSMSDLFHPDVPDAFIDKAFAVMAMAQQHTFQILTKRPERMLSYLTAQFPSAHRDRRDRISEACGDSFGWSDDQVDPVPNWPLPNVWLGVSIEDQPSADERIIKLLETPAAVHFISAEPLLGSVNVGIYLSRTNMPGLSMMPGFVDPLPGIDWVIVGGESGPKARPMSPDWVRRLRDQCAVAGVPFLFKQWGEWIPMLGQVEGVPVREHMTTADGWEMGLAGKKAAGRLLDGVQHDGYPELRP